jgi:UDP-N-acetylglucosamine--N-acetylmuramyl-(pentapeptide) pyrophosphoryl-undecaprenol N-acetylglucosamine transferase
MVKSNGILFCGGGTGGHVYPGLAVAAACRQQGIRDLRWIGDPDRLEARLVPAADIPLLPFGLGRPRLASPRWWRHALLQAWHCGRHLLARPPRAVVALGGYAALVPGLLAWPLRRRLIVMEQNARPGRTNRLLARGAQQVVTQFPEAAAWLPAARVRCLGNPVRCFQSRPRGQEEELCVLVMGGSLAAASINDSLVAAAPELARIPGFRLIHLAGQADRQRCAAAYAQAGLTAEVLGYCDDMAAVYERVDIALCRAGATTVAELCSAGIGAIYVPLPWAADDHQTANARAVARVGGAVVLPQARCQPRVLRRLLARLAAHRDEVRQLGENAQRLGRPGAAQDVVHLITGAL